MWLSLKSMSFQSLLKNGNHKNVRNGGNGWGLSGKRSFDPRFLATFHLLLYRVQFSAVLITTITRQKQRCLETLDSSLVTILVSFSGFAHGTHSISSFFLYYSAYFPCLPVLRRGRISSEEKNRGEEEGAKKWVCEIFSSRRKRARPIMREMCAWPMHAESWGLTTK